MSPLVRKFGIAGGAFALTAAPGLGRFRCNRARDAGSLIQGAGGQAETASIQWTAAVNQEAARAELLTVLARFSGSWGWQDKTDQLLWAVGGSHGARR